jgi:hypothetical protein
MVDTPESMPNVNLMTVYMRTYVRVRVRAYEDDDNIDDDDDDDR